MSQKKKEVILYLRYSINARASFLARLAECDNASKIFQKFDNSLDDYLIRALTHRAPPNLVPRTVGTVTAAAVEDHVGGDGPPLFYGMTDAELILRVMVLRSLPRNFGGLGIARYSGVEGDAARIKSRRVTLEFIRDQLASEATFLMRGAMKWAAVSVGGYDAFHECGLEGAPATTAMNYVAE